jgi:hypothetical protein
MKKILKKLLIIAAVLMIPVLLYGGYNQENVGGGIVGPYNANDCEKVNAQGQTVSAGGACGTSATVYPGGNGIMTVSGGNSYGSVLPYTAFGASIFDAANASDALADLGAAASNAIRGDSIGSNTNKLLRVDGSNNVAPVTLDSNLILSSGGNLTLNVGTGANQIVQLNSSDKLPAVDGSLLTNFTAAQVAAFSWVQGGLAPVSGKPLLQGTGANASVANITLSGTAGSTYNLDTMGGGNTTVSAAIGGNVTGGTNNSILYVGANVLAQDNTNFGWIDGSTYFHVGPALNLTNFVNTWASIIGTSDSHNYGQVIIQDLNPNGQGGLVVGGDNMTNSTHYGQIFYNGSANATLRGPTNIYFPNPNALSIYGTDQEVDISVNPGSNGTGGAIYFSADNTTAVQTITSAGVTDVNLTVSGTANVTGVTWTGAPFAVSKGVGTITVGTQTIGINATANIVTTISGVSANMDCNINPYGNLIGQVGFTGGSMLAFDCYPGAGNIILQVTNNTAANVTVGANTLYIRYHVWAANGD